MTTLEERRFIVLCAVVLVAVNVVGLVLLGAV